MFVVLKENEGGLTIGVNAGTTGFGSSLNNQGNNQTSYQGQNTLGSYGIAHHTTPNQSGYATIIPLNTASFQGNTGTVYGNAFGSNSTLGGTGTYSIASNLGGNGVGNVPFTPSGFSPTAVQRCEIDVVNPITGQIIPTFHEFTPVASYTPSNTTNTFGFGGSGYQASAASDFGTQKTLMVNLTDNDQSYCIECFSPEFDTNNSDVTLTPNGLRIRVGNENGNNTGTGFYTIPTPCDVDTDKITANSSKGYLKITLPRSKKALESFKKIKID